MPVIIVAIAIVLIASGINNKIPNLFALVNEDLAPTNGAVSFGIWLFVLFVIGAIG